MTEYRAYIVGSDGHFIRAVPLECSDDTAALKQAERLADHYDVELWQRARKGARFDHKTKMQY
jgi:hypothetical protein